nr:MAG TPA: hypothetical protein [Caudoviricetes sp.]
MRSERPKRDGSKSRDPSSSFAYLDPGIGVVEMQKLQAIPADDERW